MIKMPDFIKALEDKKQQNIFAFKTIDEPVSVGYSKTQNSTINHSKKPKNLKLIYGHNFALKFPLSVDCRIPYKDNFTKKIVLKSHIQYHFKTKFGLLKQTNKSLIVFPFFKTKAALPGESFKLKALLAQAAFKAVAKEKASHAGLKVLAPLWRPVVQEYALKDGYADAVDFTFENEFGKIDKSPHLDESGFVGSGGEIDWKTPEFADAYIKMPVKFKEMADVFAASLKEYNANIELHLKVLQDIRRAVNGGPGRPFKTSFKRSATLRATQ